MTTNRKLLVLITSVLAGCALAACGSSSSSSSSSAAASAGSTQSTAGRAKLVACLKQHGVTLPSRPGGVRRQSGSATGSNGSGGAPPGGPGAGGPGAGGGFFFGGGAGRFRANPKLQAAFKACGANSPSRRSGFGAARRQATIAARLRPA